MDFTIDEMIYLNRNKEIGLKEDLMNRIKLNIISNTNNKDLLDDNIHLEIIDFLKRLLLKISNLDDQMWEELKNQIPYNNLLYSEFDFNDYSDLENL